MPQHDRHPDKGKPPRDQTISLGIEWANGMTSKHTYFASQLRWTITGEPFDIAWFWRADGKGK